MAQSQQREGTPFWEKAVGVIGILFLVGIVGFLIYEAMQPSSPPDITVAVEQIAPATGGFLVEIQAQNLGKETAATVEIEGALKSSDDPEGEPIETSTLTFDYLPSQSSRNGGLFFQEDPGQYNLEVQAKSYIEP
jgi:uncharacterized protein (TIGR02588 family)